MAGGNMEQPGLWFTIGFFNIELIYSICFDVAIKHTLKTQKSGRGQSGCFCSLVKERKAFL